MVRPRRSQCRRSNREDIIRLRIQQFNATRPKRVWKYKDKGLAIETDKSPRIPDLKSIERKCGLRILDQTGLTIKLIAEAFYACTIRSIPHGQEEPPSEIRESRSAAVGQHSGSLLYKMWIWTKTVTKKDNMGNIRRCWCPSSTTCTLRKVCAPTYHFAICYKVDWLRSRHQQEQADELERILTTGIFHGRDDELQVTHTCGFHWCVNPSHLEVRPRSENVKQVRCHEFLNPSVIETGSDITRDEYFKSGQCQHKPACF